MSLKRSRNSPVDDASQDHQLSGHFESSPIEVRSSKFVALFSPDIPPTTLQAHPSYKTATHRILAWRKPSKQQSLLPSPNAPGKMLYDTGYDDDGEKYAGKKLVNLLTDMNIVGAVVVARWYGGILLGPQRFDHIVTVAKEAITKRRGSSSEGALAKKAKVAAAGELTPEQEAEQKRRMVTQLENRDNSIRVLRELLAEKKATSSQAADGTSGSQNEVQVKTSTGPKYATMPLKTLRQLEKAKDTTISWILKQIEEAETANAEKDAKAPE